MENIKISLDNMRYRRKPTADSEVAAISERLGRSARSLEREFLCDDIVSIGSQGRSFSPATFKNSRRGKENFEQTQWLVLDFDGGITHREVLDRAEKYELPVLFAYETLSGTDADKFRVGFMNDVPISDIRVAEASLKALGTIFPEADKSCTSDVSKMYFGGKEMLHLDKEFPEINIESLFRNMSLCLKDKYGATHYKRKIREFSEQTGIALNRRGFLDVSVADKTAEEVGTSCNGKISPKPIILTKHSDGGFSPKKQYIINMGGDTNPSAPKSPRKNHQPFRSSVLKDLKSRCQLYREFVSGDRILHHHELFGLATNLIQVETGAEGFKNILRSCCYFDDRKWKYDAWDYYLGYFNDVYKPASCDGFCQYKSLCQHGTNILSTAKVGNHQMEKLANCDEDYVSIKEAEEDFKRQFLKAVEAYCKKWYVIKAQTALGKTHIYLEFLTNTTLKVLIAVPTLILKHEIRIRAEAMGIAIIESPSLREYKDDIPEDIWVEIELLYASGKPILPLLKEYIANNDPDCADIFKEYLKKLDEFNDYDGHAITTHKKLLSIDTSKYDLVIVDEDIVFSSVITDKVNISISELRELKREMPPESGIVKKINQALKKIKANEFFTLRSTNYKKAYDDEPMGVDLSSFCFATRFCYRKSSKENGLSEDCITFLKPASFKKDTKYIMVSATVDEKICKYFFGAGNIEFSECKKARYKGVLNQYYDKSMSRACIDKDPAIIERIKELSGFEHTISFKKYGLSDLWFGNTAGCDYLKGENIDVIGTPHQTEWIYKLFAHFLKLDFNTSERLKNISVTHNGYRFVFNTYDDEKLRDIQFYLIESELEQAVGRARLLRCDCKVNLFSNFPLRQAGMGKFQYDKEK